MDFMVGYVHKIVMECDSLNIDPAIIRIGDTYYMTMTEIVGTVNNADSNADNGHYTVTLYRSGNLLDWEQVGRVLSENHNLEDIEITYENGHISLIYEMEEVDKGNSGIYIIQSEDAKGETWGEPKQLMEADCDHEPATFFSSKDGYTLYYSCDKDAVGKSYMGGKLYKAEYDSQLNLLSKDNLIETESENGLLLYDVKTIDDKFYFLCAEDYLTDCNLLVEMQNIIQ